MNENLENLENLESLESIESLESLEILTDEDVEKILTGSPLFARLYPQSIDKVFSAAAPERRLFERKDMLWQEGEVVDGIGLLLEGTLLGQHTHPDGRVQLLRIFEPFGLMNLEAAVSVKKTSPVRVTAKTAGSYLWFDYSALFKNRALSRSIVCIIQENMLHYLADDCIRFMHKTDILSRNSVRDRLLLFLSNMRSRHGNVVDVGMSQDEFARFLSVDRSSLSMELGKMKREGLVEIKGTQYTLNFPDELKTIMKR